MYLILFNAIILYFFVSIKIINKFKLSTIYTSTLALNIINVYF